jgi:cytochrome c oxidase subunit 3
MAAGSIRLVNSNPELRMARPPALPLALPLPLPLPLTAKPPEGAGPPASPPTAGLAEPAWPGHRAMWVGICLEFIEFAVFFAVYFSARWSQPAVFQEGAQRLWTLGGVLITLAMVTSGWMLTRVLSAVQQGRQRAALRWMALAVLVAALYPVLKVAEWQWNQAQGLGAGSGLFVVVYWYLTISHFVHASWGLLGMVWCLLRLSAGGYDAADHRGLESLATYWHATDLVWLMLFSLFYAYA